MDELCGPDYLTAVLGRNAIRVPAWCYVQDQGRDPQRGPVVSFIGASAFAGPDGDHPLTFGHGHYESGYGPRTDRPGYYAHYLLNGEIIFRPGVVIGTNALRAYGLGSLALGHESTETMLADGELIRGTQEMLDKIEPDRRGR